MQVEILYIWISNASRNLRQMETLYLSTKNKNKNNSNNKVITKTAITTIPQSKMKRQKSANHSKILVPYGLKHDALCVVL